MTGDVSGLDDELAPRPGPSRVGLANLGDVAAAAGVSKATVSRVFSSPHLVSEPTRARVLATADRLGYVVNGLARSMMGRGPRTVAFVVANMIGPTFAAMAAGVERVATENGHLFVLSTTQDYWDREARLITALREQRAVAVLLVGSSSTSLARDERVAGYARDLAAIGARLVLCGRPPVPRRADIASVNYGQATPITEVVVHLAKAGHRTIAFLNLPSGMTTPEQRCEGFIAGLKAGGIPPNPQLIVESKNSEQDGERVADMVLSTYPHVTALVCATDNIAVGAYRAIRRLGLRIPEDISVAGFDDVPVVGDLTPGLTTVRAPFAAVGETAARVALGLDARTTVDLPSEVILRGSIGPARRV